MEVHSNINNSHVAFNSNFSQSIEQTPSALYEVITKNLNNYQCVEHHKQYEYFYQERLICETCFHKAISSHKRVMSGEQLQKIHYLHHLRNIMNHPLILLAKQETFQYPIQVIELMLNSYQPLIGRKSELTSQKKLLNAFITRIKTRINSLCESLMSKFERMEEHLASITQYKDEMKHISKMYEQQFLELLGQKYTQGTKQQLESVLRDYQIGNENPFDKIFSNLDEVMSHLTQSPIINTQQLVDLYTTITDERLWKIDKIISTKVDNAQQVENNQLIILNSEQIMLQNQYIMQMTQEGLILKKNQKQIGRLGIVFDSLYHLNKYRLIGVNYQGIQIISYFDRLKVEEVFDIQGCTDILSFDRDIIVISNENLMRIDLHTKRCNVLGNNFKQLRYDNKNNWAFTCQNSQGRRIRWSLRPNEPFLQSIS